MKKELHENILNIYDEQGTLISTTQNKTFVLYPDKNKVIRNKLNGNITESFVGLSNRESVDNYEEIDKEN